MAVPWDRFRLADRTPVERDVEVPAAEPPLGTTTTRRVGRNGQVSFAGAAYKAGIWLAGQDVTVVCDGALVHLWHRGVAVATHARRHTIEKQPAGLRGQKAATKRRPSPTAASVTRKVDSSGNVCFAGASYRAGSKFRRRQVQVAVVGTPSSSRSAPSSSEPIPSATTAPASTAPWPTPAAGPAGSTPPNP